MVGLLFEGETIQKLIKMVQKSSTIAEISGKFKQLMKKDTIDTVLNLLTNNMGHGILLLDQKTKQFLDLCLSILRKGVPQGITRERSPSSI